MTIVKKLEVLMKRSRFPYNNTKLKLASERNKKMHKQKITNYSTQHIQTTSEVASGIVILRKTEM